MCVGGGGVAMEIQTRDGPVNLPIFRKIVGGLDPLHPLWNRPCYTGTYKHGQIMKHAYFVFKDMQHDFCKFSTLFVVQNGIKKDRTFE